MTQIKIKRAYEAPSAADGYRVLVDKLWPRGIRKENLPYDLWAKNIAPSTALRQWYHTDRDNKWNEFRRKYIDELQSSPAVRDFLRQISGQKTVTLVYGTKSPTENHALILQEYLEKHLE